MLSLSSLSLSLLSAVLKIKEKQRRGNRIVPFRVQPRSFIPRSSRRRRRRVCVCHLFDLSLSLPLSLSFYPLFSRLLAQGTSFLNKSTHYSSVDPSPPSACARPLLSLTFSSTPLARVLLPLSAPLGLLLLRTHLSRMFTEFILALERRASRSHLTRAPLRCVHLPMYTYTQTPVCR